MIKHCVLLLVLMLPTQAQTACGSPSRQESSIFRLSGAQLDAKSYLTKFIFENLLLSNKDTQNTITYFVLNLYKNMSPLKQDARIITEYETIVKGLRQGHPNLSEKIIHEIFLGLMGCITTNLAEQLKLPSIKTNDDSEQCDSEFYE
ncbi:hypothetical protein K2W90_02405 [Candidatus Babeliales bacterium]|nr:hypothetical protein [Candidatus Babeliales bacterium]